LARQHGAKERHFRFHHPRVESDGPLEFLECRRVRTRLPGIGIAFWRPAFGFDPLSRLPSTGRHVADFARKSAGGCFADFGRGCLPLFGQARQLWQTQAFRHRNRPARMFQVRDGVGVGHHGIAKPDEHPDPGRFQLRIVGQNHPLQARLVQFRLRLQISLQGA